MENYTDHGILINFRFSNEFVVYLSKFHKTRTDNITTIKKKKKEKKITVQHGMLINPRVFRNHHGYFHFRGRIYSKRNRLFALTDAPIRKQESPCWNFIINMRTAGRLLNNSTVASRLAAMNFIDIN